MVVYITLQRKGFQSLKVKRKRLLGANTVPNLDPGEVGFLCVLDHR